MILHDRSSWVLPGSGAGLSLARNPADLQEIEKVATAGLWQLTAESLSHHKDDVPSRFADAKFGIFTHGTIYTVPEWGNELYPRNMYIQDSPAFTHHRQVYGPQHTRGYKSFIPLFTAACLEHSVPIELHVSPHGEHCLSLGTCETSIKASNDYGIEPDVQSWFGLWKAWVERLFPQKSFGR